MPHNQHAPRRPNPIDVHVGTRIRLRRQMLKMSQEVLGDNLGVTFQQVQKYERGANRVGASRLFKISQTLAVPVQFFFDGLSQEYVEQGSVDEKTTRVEEFINSSDGVSLAIAISGIENKDVRRQVLELARSLSE